MSEEAVMTENTEDTVQESGSLLSVETPQDQSAEPEAMPHMEGDVEQPVESEFEWGDRPDFIPEQFWSSEDGPDLEALAKSYTELRTKFSQGKHKAPKDGNYDIGSLKDHGITEDDPLLSDFSAFAKEAGMSQDQFDAITQMYMQHVGEMFGDVETDVQAEMDKLGKNGEKIIQSTSQWLTKMQSSGVLSAEEADAVANAATSADFVKALDKIRGSYGEKSIPAIDIQESGSFTKAELDAMVADPRYGKDMHYTQGVERKFMEFFGEA